MNPNHKFFAGLRVCEFAVCWTGHHETHYWDGLKRIALFGGTLKLMPNIVSDSSRYICLAFSRSESEPDWSGASDWIFVATTDGLIDYVYNIDPFYKRYQFCPAYIELQRRR